MTQILFTVGLFAILIQSVMTVSANLSATNVNLQARSVRFSTEQNVRNTLSVHEFCKIAMQGQTVNVNNRTTRQPIRVYSPDSSGNRGPAMAAADMTVGPLQISEVSLQMISSVGTSHLARFHMQLSARGDNAITLLRPMEMELVLEGTPNGAGQLTIGSCRTNEEWTGIKNMKTCPSDQIVAGFKSDGSLICQVGPVGPAGPAGGSGASGCSDGAPGVPSVCVSTGTGGSTWQPL